CVIDPAGSDCRCSCCCTVFAATILNPAATSCDSSGGGEGGLPAQPSISIATAAGTARQRRLRVLLDSIGLLLCFGWTLAASIHRQAGVETCAATSTSSICAGSRKRAAYCRYAPEVRNSSNSSASMCRCRLIDAMIAMACDSVRPVLYGRSRAV